jgi:hypothetical protein
MISRDEYVQKLKAQVDAWNAEMAQWEALGKDATAAAQERFAKQVDQVRARRDEALVEIRRLQSASMDAWRDMMRGADDAVRSMQEAFEKARKNYDKK